MSEQGDYHSVGRCRLENILIADPDSTWSHQDSPSHKSQRRHLHLQTNHTEPSPEGRAVRPGITVGPVAHQQAGISQASLGGESKDKTQYKSFRTLKFRMSYFGLLIYGQFLSHFGKTFDQIFPHLAKT